MHALFEIRSMFLIGAICCLICATTLFASRRLHRPSRPALRWAAAALVCEALAMAGYAMRGIAPDALPYVVSGTLAPAGMVLVFESTRRLCGRRPQVAAGLALMLALLTIQITLGTSADADSARVVIASAVQGTLAAVMVPMLWRQRRIDPPLPVVSALVFACVFAAAHLARAASTVGSGPGATPGDGIDGGIGQALMVALLALSPLVYAMILLTWVNGRIARELRAMATTDELTGLMVRRSFFEQARATLDGGTVDGTVSALFMLDLDRFKLVNDRYGHATGDRALAHFAGVMRRQAAPADLLGRYGGEEFCALVTRRSAQEVLAAAESLCAAVRATPMTLGGERIGLTVSIGVAHRQHACSLETLLVAADRFVYLAKALGRNQVIDREQTLRSRALTTAEGEPLVV